MFFRARAVTAVALAAAAVTAAGCGTGYEYAKREHPKMIYRTAAGGGGLAQIEAASTYFKLPPGWDLLDEEEFIEDQGLVDGQTPEQQFIQRSKIRSQPFDAAPQPSVEHILQAGTSHPSGFSQLLVLDDDERDGVSLNSLRNFGIRTDADPLTGESEAEVLYRDDHVVRSGGFRGSRVIFNLPVRLGAVMTIDKTTLIDEDTRVVYMFVIGCEAMCFRQNQKAISEVVDSWTIKDE